MKINKMLYLESEVVDFLNKQEKPSEFVSDLLKRRMEDEALSNLPTDQLKYLMELVEKRDQAMSEIEKITGLKEKP